MNDNDRMDFCGELCKYTEDLIKHKNAQILELQGNLKFVRGTNERLIEQCYEKDTEIVRLKNMVGQNEGVLPQYENLIKAEAIKEFAERLKESAFACDVSFGFGREHCEKAVTVLEIDNLVKEMTEETP